MSYIVHMSKGNDLELDDTEYQNFKGCVEDGVVYKRKKTGEMTNPAFFINSEKVPEVLMNDPDAVEKFMERQRAPSLS